MGGGNGGDAQLMQGQHGEPVFVVPLEHQHDPVALFQPRGPEGVRHAVGLFLDIGKGKKTLLVFRVAPDHGPFFRGFGGNGIHHVVGKVKIVGIMEGDIRECPVFTHGFLTESFINAHVCSFT